MVVMAASLFWFSHLGVSESFWALLPRMLLVGVGMSLAMAPVTAAAMSSVRPDKAGVGSAVLNSMRQVGGSLGIAVMGAIVASVTSSSLAAGDPRPVAFVNGLHRGLDVAGVIALAAALIAVVTLGHPHHPHSQAAPDFAP